MPYPTAFLDELRARTPVSDVVGRSVKLVRAGREMKACCPFHNEKTPSFYVNDAKGFFHCFGCGAHGDAIGFAMRAHGLSFPEAVERLAADAGMEVPRPDPEDRKRWERQKTLHDLLERACRWFEEQLRAPAGREALAYLERRGLGGRVAERWRLGYAPADGGALRKAMAADGWSDDDMVEAGLLKRPDDGRSPYAFFRDRVLFPVADPRGRVVAFGGRLLSGEGPKYVNSADGPLFHKGRLFYGLSRARGAAAAGRPLALVEGYADVIALTEAGIAAVAPLGTAVTKPQLDAAWRLSPRPVICLDGDAAGRRAAARILETALPLLRPDRSLAFASLPEGLDPDDLIRERGADAVREVLAGAGGVVDALFTAADAAGFDLGTPEGRAARHAFVFERLDHVEHRALRYELRGEAFARLRGRRPAASTPSIRPSPPPREETPADLILLALLIRAPAIWPDVAERVVDAQVGRCRELLDDVVETLTAAPATPETPALVLLDRLVEKHGESVVERVLLASRAVPLDAAEDVVLAAFEAAWADRGRRLAQADARERDGRVLRLGDGGGARTAPGSARDSNIALVSVRSATTPRR